MLISDSPTSPSASLGLPVFRLLPGRTAKLSLQSSAPLFLCTHWLGRQIPCAGPGCPACEVTRVRDRGFCLALLETGHSRHPVLVEASSQEWSRLHGFRTMEGLTYGPGLLVEASRKKKNSPLRMEPISAAGAVDEQFSPPWRLCAALAVLFSLPVPLEGTDVAAFCEAVRPVVARQLRVAIATTT